MIDCLHDDFYWRSNTNSKTEERATAYHKQQQTTGSNGIERDRIGHGMKGQHRTAQDRTGQHRTGQDSIGENRIGRHRIGQHRIGQCSSGQEKV